MKMKFYSYALMAAAFTVGMSSCQNDEFIAPAEDAADLKTYAVSATFKFENDETRSVSQATNTGIKTAWENGDKMMLVNETGTRNMGVLVYDAEKKSFEGNVKATSKDTKANVYFLGDAFKDNDQTLFADNIEYNFSKQFAPATHLVDYNLQHCVSDLVRDEATKKITLSGELECLVGSAKFYFHLPNGVSATNENIVISGANVKNAFNLNLADGTLGDLKDGEMTITDVDWTVGAANEGEAYVKFIPAENVVTEFTVTIAGKTYKAALDARKYSAGKFFAGGSIHGKDIYFSENGDWSVTYKYMDNKTADKVETATNFGPSQSFTIIADPSRDGYEFAGWKNVADNKVYKAGETLTLTRPVTAATLEAQWTATDYTLYFISEGKDAGSMNQNAGEVNEPWKFNIAGQWDCVKEGYTLIGWDKDPAATNVVYGLDATVSTGGADKKTVTIYAVWKKNVTSGNITTPGSKGVNYGY